MIGKTLIRKDPGIEGVIEGSLVGQSVFRTVMNVFSIDERHLVV